MLTLFAVPKPFTGKIATLQRNAIRSWTCLNPKPQILLIGDEAGTAEAAAELGVQHLFPVARNSFGTPLINDVIEKAEAASEDKIFCYINADIILLDDFMRAVEQVANLK